ncbi:MAG: six-cysteine ranthipeptide SCIFF [Eubacteriaceae bacterium]|nr:six-cysteine ranthipeptide SCIFF [Eubacteriaceae bacterium]
MKHINQINNDATIHEEENCQDCKTSCQSACKTSCTVGNQSCEKESTSC